MADLTRYDPCTLPDPAPDRSRGQDPAGGCTTCGDVGIPVRVIRLLRDGVALCEDRAGHRAEIAIAFTPDAAPGHVLLVHMGVAIARLQEALP